MSSEAGTLLPLLVVTFHLSMGLLLTTSGEMANSVLVPLYWAGRPPGSRSLRRRPAGEGPMGRLSGGVTTRNTRDGLSALASGGRTVILDHESGSATRRRRGVKV